MNKVVFCTKGKIGSEHCPSAHESVSYHTQVLLEHKCEIPCEKPDSENLIGKFHTIKFSKTELLDSVELLHGRPVNGKKLIVTGIFQLGIEYLAKHTPSVHYLICKMPFNTIVYQSSPHQESLFPPDFALPDYSVYGCPEHVEVVRVSERLFEISIVLMIWLQKN